MRFNCFLRTFCVFVFFLILIPKPNNVKYWEGLVKCVWLQMTCCSYKATYTAIFPQWPNLNCPGFSSSENLSEMLMAKTEPTTVSAGELEYNRNPENYFGDKSSYEASIRIVRRPQNSRELLISIISHPASVF